MPVFNYIAVDDSGRILRGREEAASEGALETLLGDKGHWLTEASEQSVARKGPGKKGGCRVPRRLLVEFFMQMSIQLRAGIPILSALEFGASECGHAGFRLVQKDLVERVESGSSLSEALAVYPRVFPPLVLNLVRAGEASGRISESCQELRRYYEWVDRMVADVRQALVYPMFILVCTVLFVLLLFTFLVPRFAAMLTEMKVPLPLLTMVVMDISDFLVGWWYAVIGGMVLLFFLPSIAKKFFPQLEYHIDAFKLKLPIFGPLLRLICLSRFAHNLGVLYRAGVALLESLELSKGLVGNKVVEEAVGEIQLGVNEGLSIHETMARQGVFSKLILQMVKVGESTGGLGESLQHVADYYNEIIPRQVKKLFTIMEPVMILGLIGIVAMVALAIFLPIANLLTAR